MFRIYFRLSLHTTVVKKRDVSGSINDVTPIGGRIKWLCDDNNKAVLQKCVKMGEGCQKLPDVIHERSLNIKFCNLLGAWMQICMDG